MLVLTVGKEYHQLLVLFFRQDSKVLMPATLQGMSGLISRGADGTYNCNSCGSSSHCWKWEDRQKLPAISLLNVTKKTLPSGWIFTSRVGGASRFPIQGTRGRLNRVKIIFRKLKIEFSKVFLLLSSHIHMQSKYTAITNTNILSQTSKIIRRSTLRLFVLTLG